MPFQRFIPALSTIGVIAGLAAARMMVEVVPFGRAAEVVSSWVHDAPEPAPARAPEVVARPKRAMAAPANAVSVTVREGREKFEANETPAIDVSPKASPTSPRTPTITNSALPEMPEASWVGA
jgi:hypothetical protein